MFTIMSNVNEVL